MKLAVRKIWFTGSKRYYDRLVYENEDDGTYWVYWYRPQMIQVKLSDSGNWHTVEPY